MTLDWCLTFLRQGQICVPMYLYGENIENSVSYNVLMTNGWSLQCMIKVANPRSYNQNFDLPGFSALASPAIYIYKIL